MKQTEKVIQKESEGKECEKYKRKINSVGERQDSIKHEMSI